MVATVSIPTVVGFQSCIEASNEFLITKRRFALFMPLYLSLVICVALLSGCAGTGDVLSGPPVYGAKDLQRLRTYYGKPLAAGTSAAADSARRDYKADYGALVVAATYKDRSALATLMSFSPMDGEAGDEHANTLTLLLSGLGDDFFSSVLKSQPRAVRKSLLGDLGDSDLKAHSPKTFGMGDEE
jgi:hypothetical protein